MTTHTSTNALAPTGLRSYVFRVANKDMTYAQQLKDYENAVIQKRFEELSEEEVRSRPA